MRIPTRIPAALSGGLLAASAVFLVLAPAAAAAPAVSVGDCVMGGGYPLYYPDGSGSVCRGGQYSGEPLD
ncbi:hypothetical protein ACIA8R_31960 [Nonomuraea sp. NPDC051191]|uniref:hypothetical protein n=1 Tax=Nonomuraea sp. NPDC051191 TaxID=3364372 RepID=UPI0037B76EE3